GDELWKSDGTEQGTVLVKDIYPGRESSDPTYLTNVNSTLFFTAFEPNTGYELWKSDGTEAGTVLVKDIYPGFTYNDYTGEFYVNSSYPQDLTNVNGTLFFTADDGVYGDELWKSDGTEAGTVLVKDINPGSVGSNPNDLTDVNGTLFFTAVDGVNGGQVWKSD